MDGIPITYQRRARGFCYINPPGSKSFELKKNSAFSHYFNFYTRTHTNTNADLAEAGRAPPVPSVPPKTIWPPDGWPPDSLLFFGQTFVG